MTPGRDGQTSPPTSTKASPSPSSATSSATSPRLLALGSSRRRLSSWKLLAVPTTYQSGSCRNVLGRTGVADRHLRERAGEDALEVGRLALDESRRVAVDRHRQGARPSERCDLDGDVDALGVLLHLGHRGRSCRHQQGGAERDHASARVRIDFFMSSSLLLLRMCS